MSFAEFREEIIEKLTKDADFLKQIASMQYTITDKNLSLRITKFIKKNFSEQVFNCVDEALFEFELDMGSVTS